MTTLKQVLISSRVSLPTVRVLCHPVFDKFIIGIRPNTYVGTNGKIYERLFVTCSSGAGSSDCTGKQGQKSGRRVGCKVEENKEEPMGINWDNWISIWGVGGGGY